MREDQSIIVTNARLGSEVTSVRIVHGRIAGIGSERDRRDRVIDVAGERLMPGLINAHDHLQLNGFPRQKYRDHYQNVRDWIADVAARREQVPTLAAAASRARDERLLLGGLKNLLSGVTTVAHHDPFYDFLRNTTFPTRVVAQYGWSHSLQIDGEDAVQRSYRGTPATQPWIIHAAEGIDDEARGEFDRLETLGCIGPNTLLVHGVALSSAQRKRLVTAGAGLIWCPTSNLHLFGRTLNAVDLIESGRVALGSDSRLSGGRDLLVDLQAARSVAGIGEAALESLVTDAAARLLRLPDRGEVRTGALADLIVVPASRALSSLERADIRLVMVGGQVRYADAAYADVLCESPPPLPLTVDGRRKVVDGALGRLLSRAGVIEQDLAGSLSEGRAA